ncbi:amidoxime-reducing component 1 [Fusarium oxysporum f. sp. albedinis]|nr:amidoxime-reducing component 1 [Fusarium oxysporum f. sp. albedinis]
MFCMDCEIIEACIAGQYPSSKLLYQNPVKQAARSCDKVRRGCAVVAMSVTVDSLMIDMNQLHEPGSLVDFSGERRWSF